ncbi:MAG: phosphoglycolate/pyridoxal phosphate family phosphatase [Armatimonadetes bacterium]|nr:phosphoglycolate/pyridoxal phosphate family phosphatase [Armatimonadota bacterium]
MRLRTFVFDLDGVIYRGEQLLPGVAETIETLRRFGHQVYFFTNNSTKTREQYVDKLHRMGILVDKAQIMTSGYATSLYFCEHGAKGKSVYLIGEPGLRQVLIEAGMRIVENIPEEKADYVVVGWDKGFNYEKITKALWAIRGGAEFIATNRDATYPLEGGQVVPGAGAMVAAVEAATGVTPRVIGKPETYAVRKLFEVAGASLEDSVIVGDRLDTDILVGKRLGITTILVLTGISTEKDVEVAPKEIKPDFVVKTLPEILGLFLGNAVRAEAKACSVLDDKQ